jgi:hypothetical protein
MFPPSRVVAVMMLMLMLLPLLLLLLLMLPLLLVMGPKQRAGAEGQEVCYPVL